jgi:rhomboid protease GluP
MNRQSILCPKCRKLISKDEPRCPYCGIRRPGAWWKNKFNIRGEDFPIRAILFINVGMYLISLLFNSRNLELSLNPLTVLSPDDRSLLLLGATGTLPILQMERWWTLITANYLHGNLLHIFFNMVAFRQLASFVLREYGPHRFVVLYTLTGIAGFWVSYLAAVPLTIGASAAVCGLIGASLYYGKSRGGVYGQAIYKQVGGWAIGIFVFGFLLSGISNWANVPSINNWAHGGGIAAGVILGFLLGYRERKQEMFWHRYLAFGCVLITVVALAWAIAIGAYFRFA